MDKESQRDFINLKLKSLNQSELGFKSSKVSNILFKFLSELKIPNNLIGFYSPLKTEVNWLYGAIENYSYSIPSIKNDQEMDFYEIPLSDLIEKKFGLAISDGFKKVYPKVLVIPGLAFSTNGQRLGRGKGYYDRYLSDHKVLKIGICFNEQILKEVKTESHDVLMDYIINENTVFKGNK